MSFRRDLVCLISLLDASISSVQSRRRDIYHVERFLCPSQSFASLLLQATRGEAGTLAGFHNPMRMYMWKSVLVWAMTSEAFRSVPDSCSTNTAHIPWCNQSSISEANMKLLHLCLTIAAWVLLNYWQEYICISIAIVKSLHLCVKVLVEKTFNNSTNVSMSQRQLRPIWCLSATAII